MRAHSELDVSHGCKCAECMRAAARARKRSWCGMSHLTDATKAKAAIRDLRDGGWTWNAIGVAVGVSGAHLRYVAETASRVDKDLARLERVGSLYPPTPMMMWRTPSWNLL